MLADIMTKGLARDRFQNLRNLLIIYVCWNIDRYFLCNPRGGGGVLGISSDGDDRRIFFKFEIFDSGILLGTKIWLGY